MDGDGLKEERDILFYLKDNNPSTYEDIRKLNSVNNLDDKSLVEILDNLINLDIIEKQKNNYLITDYGKTLF